jgi:hypothetical protein
MKKIFFGLGIVLVSVIAVGGTIFAYNVSEPIEEVTSQNQIPKAAIIDQLYSDIPNENFHELAIEYLEGAGYEVDIFNTEQVTVDFYKKLPSMNYDFVIIRSHGAADKTDQDSVTLFTGEKYQEDKYISEQLFGHAKRVTPVYAVTYDTTEDNSEWVIVNDTYRERSSPVNIDASSSEEYFAITPKLIDQAMEGKFSGTTFVLAGCSTMKSSSMAESLVRLGASEVVGWDGDVVSAQNDMVVLGLLEELFVSKVTMSEAIDSVMDKFPLESFGHQSRLNYYN